MRTAGRKGVTQEEVARVADALVKEGKDPTIRRVHSVLGGSNSTLVKHMQAWEAMQTPKAEATVSERLLRELQAEIAHHIQAQTSEMATRLGNLQDDMQALAEEGQRTADELEACLQQLSSVKQVRDELAGKYQQLQQELARMEQRFTDELAFAEGEKQSLVTRLHEANGDRRRLEDEVARANQRSEDAEKRFADLVSKLVTQQQARSA